MDDQFYKQTVKQLLMNVQVILSQLHLIPWERDVEIIMHQFLMLYCQIKIENSSSHCCETYMS